MPDLDHATLVARAVTWLRKTERCNLVLDDAGTERGAPTRSGGASRTATRMWRGAQNAVQWRKPA